MSTSEHLLKPGQCLHTEVSRTPCVIKEFLGSGGQGQVYKVDVAGQEMALKWYKPEYLPLDPNLRIRLKNAINHGPPSPRFLWPQELLLDPQQSTFGYLMNLRGAEYLGILRALKEERYNFQVLAMAGLQLAENFALLHSLKGLCYVDINWGGIFLKPNTGDILICDNDNVSETGAVYTPFLGTVDFGAPEFWRGEAPPSRETDLYSLAVLFFQMFMLHHPMHGRLERQFPILDPKATQELYTSQPVFIFDPDNESNRPIPGDDFYDTVSERWSILPQFARKCFLQTFTDGLKHPSQRVAESIWRTTMVQLRDSIFLCPHCGGENFIEPLELKPDEPYGRHCWYQDCQQLLPSPLRLRVGKHLVMLNVGTQLFPHHLVPGKQFDFSTPLATVIYNAQRQILGLNNATRIAWQVATSAGTEQEIPPGRNFGPLKPGIKIKFGDVCGELLG
jgi:eukaryotic-like serine/threonine-protein kinase